MRLYDFLFGDKEISIFQEDTFRRITVLLSLLIGLSIPVDMFFHLSQQIDDLLILFTYGFALLWTRNKFTLLGFYLIGLKFNNRLLNNQLISDHIWIDFTNILKWTGLILSTTGIIFLIYGIWKYYKDEDLVKIKKQTIISAFVNIIVITMTLQLVFHSVIKQNN